MLCVILETQFDTLEIKSIEKTGFIDKIFMSIKTQLYVIRLIVKFAVTSKS